jgi:hypothetical protein
MKAGRRKTKTLKIDLYSKQFIKGTFNHNYHLNNYQMTNHFIVLGFFSLMISAGYAQIDTAKGNESQQKYFKTFFLMQQYLQEHQTMSLPYPESKPGIHSAGEVFYDTVINRFFNVALMAKYLSRDANYFSLHDKVQLIRYYLNVFDRSLDSLPPNFYHVEMNTEKDMIDEVEL